MTDTLTQPELPQVSIDDLLKMIGDRDVTIQRQGLLIAQQATRLAELNKGNGKASDVTTAALNAASISPEMS